MGVAAWLQLATVLFWARRGSHDRLGPHSVRREPGLRHGAITTTPAQVFLDLKYVGGMDEVQEMLDCGTFKQTFDGYIAG